MWTKISKEMPYFQTQEERKIMNRAKKIIMVCVFLATVGMLTACGTVRGFGKDVTNVGHGIQRASHL